QQFLPRADIPKLDGLLPAVSRKQPTSIRGESRSVMIQIELRSCVLFSGALLAAAFIFEAFPFSAAMISSNDGARHNSTRRLPRLPESHVIARYSPSGEN